MAAAETDDGPIVKRVRWTNSELESMRNMYDDGPVTGDITSSEERDARAAQMALVAYDHNEVTTSESGMDEDEIQGLTPDQLEMWQTLYATLEKLARDLPFCEDCTYPWLDVDSPKPEHTPFIHQVLAILFGTWCREGGVKRLYGEDVRVRVYLQNGSCVGRTSCERGQAQVLFQSIENRAVYIESSTSLNQLAIEYVNCLRRHKVFDKGSESYFVPPSLFVDLAGAIVSVIVGSVNREPAPNGPFSMHIENVSHRGIESVPMPNRRMWAIGRYVMIVPKPIDSQGWYSQIPMNMSAVPQIKVILPNVDDVPTIPMTRHFKMSVDEETKFIDFLKQVCGCVISYAKTVYRDESEEDARQWISDATFKFLHQEGNVRSFMSFLGAQYMQSTCVELQEPEFKNVNIAVPRAYYTTDERYGNNATEEERRIVAMFVNVLGMTMFSYRSDISGLVGVPGTNKSTFIDLLQVIAGGMKVVLVVNEKYDKFTLGSALMTGRSPFLMVVSDSFDGTGGLSPELKDGFIGKTRSALSVVTSNPKGVNSKSVEVEQIAGVMCRNKPPKSIIDRADLSDIEKWKASVVGSHDGDMRRGFPAPPMTISLHAGTVNPSRRINGKTVVAYEKERLENASGCEIPYIMVIMWMVTILAESVPDKTFGLAGSNNPILMETIKRYVEPPNENIAELMDAILERCNNIITKQKVKINNRPATITVQQSAEMSTVVSYLSAKVGPSYASKPLPSTYTVTKNKLICSKCKRAFYGVRLQELIEFLKSVDKAALSNANRFFKSKCPKANTPCIKHLVRADVIMGFKIRDVSGQDNTDSPQLASIFQKHS